MADRGVVMGQHPGAVSLNRMANTPKHTQIIPSSDTTPQTLEEDVLVSNLLKFVREFKRRTNLPISEGMWFSTRLPGRGGGPVAKIEFDNRTFNE